ncbi:MAG: ABC transporter ATP-binding protein [Betaproteobacteria bacterium]|nr:ABC transporter ATP-binding protein [Betaproteobacteria bacterium]
MSALLELRNVRHSYGDREVLSNLTIYVDKGMIACLLGASGCGKTTVLRCIAGFEPVTAGAIAINGVVMSRPGDTTPPEKRRVGIVFQDFALFPHLTVARNIAFGLRTAGDIQPAGRVSELLATVGLEQVANRYPHELSGGQQQRVALARALAPRPDVMLLDEPFSNLDVTMRERLAQEVRDILKQQNTTAILVTHEQNEAFNIADEIGIMAEGAIEQWGTPYQLYHEPATRFVADFIGQGVFLPGTVTGHDEVRIELGVVRGPLPEACGHGAPVDVLTRPDDIVHDDASPMRAQVVHKAFRGAEFLYTLQLPSGGRVLSLVPSHHDHDIGEPIGIRLDMNHLVAFPRAQT